LTVKLTRKAYDVIISLIIRLNLPLLYVLVEELSAKINMKGGKWRFKRVRIQAHSLHDATIVHQNTLVNVFTPNYSQADRSLKKVLPQPPIYVKNYENVEIIGGLSYIIKGMCAYADLHELQGLKRVSLVNDLVTFHNKDIAVISCKEADTLIDEGVMLSGTASYNYYHWLMEFIPKLSLFTRKQIETSNFIVDEAVMNCPPLLESLQYIIKTNNLTAIKRGYKYKINKLIYPSLLSWTTINLQKGLDIQASDSLTSPEAISFLRQTFGVAHSNTGGGKIYISRAGSLLRKYNEADIIPIVKKYGFEVCAPEKLSFLQQVKLFSESKYIIGATGSGMTNIVFAPQCARILCLTSMRMNFAGFSNIAGIIGQHMVFMEGTMKTDKKALYEYQNHFSVDVDRFETAVKRLIAE